MQFVAILFISGLRLTIQKILISEIANPQYTNGPKDVPLDADF